MNGDTPQEQTYRHTPSLEEQRLARLYAQALLNAADKAGQADEIKGELHELVHEVFRQNPQFENLLASSVVGKHKKEGILQNAFSGKTTQLFYNFLMVLNNKDRLSIIRTILDQMIDLDNRRKRLLPVKVTTAVAMSDEQRNQLTEDLRSGFELEPVLESIVDTDILGGMIVQVGDLVLDSSVRGEIEAIRKTLLTRGSHVIQSGRDTFSHSG